MRAEHILQRARNLADNGVLNPLAALSEVGRIGSGSHARALLMMNEEVAKLGWRNLVDFWERGRPNKDTVLELYDEAIFRATLEGA